MIFQLRNVWHNQDFYDDNDIVSRFPSDRTDSIHKDLPTISNQFDTNTTEISSVNNQSIKSHKSSQLIEHTSSLDIIPSPKPFDINKWRRWNR